jgi:hypothetical protein
MNIVEKAAALLAEWCAANVDPPKYLSVGLSEWNQLIQCETIVSDRAPKECPNGWDSGVSIFGMRVIVFTSPESMLLLSDAPIAGAHQSHAE